MFQQGTCNMEPRNVLRNHSRNRNPWMSVTNTQHAVHSGVQNARVVLETCYSPFARSALHLDASMASSQMSRCIMVSKSSVRKHYQGGVGTCLGRVTSQSADLDSHYGS